MNKCPIQVVLNSSEYITDDETPRKRGYHKDYYAGNDDEFIAHRQNISSQLDTIQSLQEQSEYTKFSYAKVTLNKKAHAKSNRPFNKVITKSNGCKIIGGNRAGEMIVRFSPTSSQSIKEGIEQAEDTTTWTVNKQGKKVAKPSPWRSDLGAIDSIVPFSAEDKGDISSAEILSYIEKHQTCRIYIELFESQNTDEDHDNASQEWKKMFSSLREGLKKIRGVELFKSSLKSASNLFVITVYNNTDTQIDFDTDILSSNTCNAVICTDTHVYDELISLLTCHPAVRRISIPPTIDEYIMPAFNFDCKEITDIPYPTNLENHPIVGVIDTGISSIYDDWIVAKFDRLMDRDKDRSHGTFISGLEVIGKTLNKEICLEEDGCRLVDICIMPKKGSFNTVYKFGIDEFSMVLRSAVAEAAERTGAKVFNLSLNIPKSRLREEYSDFARELDSIADDYGVIFIISAGNLNIPRSEWDVKNPEANIYEISNRSDDIVYAPGESIRNITVGALNPPTNLGLTSYSCKGHGSSIGVKPDLMQVGGLGFLHDKIGTGLYSTQVDGTIVSECGTSYSAPIVAKTIAAIDNQIEGGTPRETLIALAIHNSSIPEPLKDRKYTKYLKEIIGYGQPKCSTDILNGNEHEITLVFNNKIKPRQILSFPFSWPQSLIKNGKCSGRYKLTLVSTPRIEYSYGEEMVRDDVQISLVQINEFGERTGRLQLLYGPDSSIEIENGATEEERKQELKKWQPTKVFEKTLKGVSVSKGTWRLEVRYLSRDNSSINYDGVPFTIALTISDPDETAPVYNEMRFALQSEGARITEIQTAARVQPRV